MDWVKAFPEAELTEGVRKIVVVAGRKILVLRIEEQIFAVDNACPHMRFPLKDGRVTDDCGIICPFHHSAFDLKIGDVKAWSPWPPGIGAVAGRIVRERALPVYATKIEDGYLWVSKVPSN